MAEQENNKPRENATPKIAKIVVDRDLCIGAASCVAIAPGVFALDEENKAYVVSDKGADDETILLAALALSLPYRSKISFSLFTTAARDPPP